MVKKRHAAVPAAAGNETHRTSWPHRRGRLKLGSLQPPASLPLPAPWPLPAALTACPCLPLPAPPCAATAVQTGHSGQRDARAGPRGQVAGERLQRLSAAGWASWGGGKAGPWGHLVWCSSQGQWWVSGQPGSAAGHAGGSAAMQCTPTAWMNGAPSLSSSVSNRLTACAQAPPPAATCVPRLSAPAGVYSPRL